MLQNTHVASILRVSQQAGRKKTHASRVSETGEIAGATAQRRGNEAPVQEDVLYAEYAAQEDVLSTCYAVRSRLARTRWLPTRAVQLKQGRVLIYQRGCTKVRGQGSSPVRESSDPHRDLTSPADRSIQLVRSPLLARNSTQRFREPTVSLIYPVQPRKRKVSHNGEIEGRRQRTESRRPRQDGLAVFPSPGTRPSCSRHSGCPPNLECHVSQSVQHLG